MNLTDLEIKSHLAIKPLIILSLADCWSVFWLVTIKRNKCRSKNWGWEENDVVMLLASSYYYNEKVEVEHFDPYGLQNSIRSHFGCVQANLLVHKFTSDYMKHQDRTTTKWHVILNE